MNRIVVLSACALLLPSLAAARKVDRKTVDNIQRVSTTTTTDSWRELGRYDKVLRAPAQLDTTYLIGPGGQHGSGTFEGGGGSCFDEGWVPNDVTAQLDNYWHVDDFAGLAGVNGGLVPLEGSQSMWCGARPDNTHPIKCSYINLPGYANSWNQSLITDQCLTVTGDVTFGFQIFWNSENNYDFTYVQWDECDGSWRNLVGDDYYNNGLSGLGQWDTTFTVADTLHSGNIRFRFHFQSDGAWSDGDGGGNTDGGCTVDALVVDDGSGNVLALEEFEDETVGDHDGNDWVSVTAPGYGELAALFHGFTLVQEDPCFTNLSCVWAFINGSTSDYGCGTPSFPEQATVPYENAHSQYVDQQIWSPWLDITTSSGTVFEMNYLNYWDLKIPNWVFSDYRVRSIDSTAAIPCPGIWREDGFVNYGDEKIWHFWDQPRPVGLLVEDGATHIQISLDVVDYCQYGFPCANSCHSHAPIYDDVTVYRVSAAGPQFYIRDIDQFQDNFPDDGTITGTARADIALDVNWSDPSSAIVPGDKAVVQVSDPEAGLDTEGNGRASVFVYVSVDGPNSGTAAATLTEDAALSLSARGRRRCRRPYVAPVPGGLD